MKSYIISEKILKQLIEDSWELTRLINNGVDNWEGYYEPDEMNADEDITPEEYIKNNFKEVSENENNKNRNI